MLRSCHHGGRTSKYFNRVCKQKQIWLNHYLPTFTYHFAQGGATKQRWAKPTHLLVDDYEKNVKDWRAKGGVALHFTHDYSTGRTKKDCLELLKTLDLLL